jgi:hypothetical protein
VEFKQTLVQEALKSSPPVTIVGAQFLGMPMNDWVLVLTLVYLSLQILFLLRDKVWYKNDRRKT